MCSRAYQAWHCRADLGVVWASPLQHMTSLSLELKDWDTKGSMSMNDEIYWMCVCVCSLWFRHISICSNFNISHVITIVTWVLPVCCCWFHHISTAVASPQLTYFNIWDNWSSKGAFNKRGNWIHRDRIVWCSYFNFRQGLELLHLREAPEDPVRCHRRSRVHVTWYGDTTWHDVLPNSAREKII